jgi:hypothetical protein
MDDNNFGDLFNSAIKALLDALSYVDEFDANTFLSSLFSISSETKIFPEDDWSKSAGKQAKEFLDKANEFITTLLAYHPRTDQNVRYSRWHNESSYKTAVHLLDMLQRTVEVIPTLKKTAETIKGISHITARQGLMTFKKECEEAIFGINNIIGSYNRYIDVGHKLTIITIPK